MPGRPNILFVFSDQQRYSALGANGNTVAQTPNLEPLAAEGLVCDSYFSNHPLCSPYRVILMRYSARQMLLDVGSHLGHELDPHTVGKISGIRQQLP